MKKMVSSGKKVYCNEVLYLEENDRSYLKYSYAINKGVKVEEINLNKPDNHLLNYQLYQNDCNEEIVDLCNLEIPFLNKICCQFMNVLMD